MTNETVSGSRDESVVQPTVAGVASDETGAVSAEPEEFAPEPIETRTEVEVGLVRSVRIGPILIGFMILGAVVAAVSALFFPVSEDATYTLAQAAGFVSLVGAAFGLFVGGVLCLILSKVAKRQSGAARAVLTDVR